MSVTQQMLSEFDFKVLIDKSASMGTEDMPGGRSRWAYMQETAEQFCRELDKVDADGIDVILFSGASILPFRNVNAAKVRDLFSDNAPRSSTPLAQALQVAFDQAATSSKKVFILCFTDGEPDDKEAVKKTLIAQSNKQEKDEDCTVLFVQVGYDAGATRYLKTLDDDLTGAKFDIVDVKTIDEAEKFASITDLVVAAIDD
jgi:Mg-chelatase subunit ChlD